ncbi:MAG: TIGR01212 family radical SAM protein [Pirellulaceae bacterium]
MSSTYTPSERWTDSQPWRAAGLRYFAYKVFLRHHFGFRVQRVSVDAGFTCPNVDGSVAKGGCVFCNNTSFSPSRRLSQLPGPRRSISQQISEGISRLKRRYGDCEHFIAYFQPATNTYAPVDRLQALYEQALAHPAVIGLAIGTRPDCVGDDILSLLTDIARRRFLSVEYGMQTMHDRSLDWMNRGHHHDAMVDAVLRSRHRGFEIGAHVILGLPGESREDMQDTARELARLQVDAVKLHNLYVVRNTSLAEQVERGETRLVSRDEYVRSAVDTLERLPPHTVIQRMGGEAPGQYFLGPSWCLDKSGLQRAIEQELVRRDTCQGHNWMVPAEPQAAHPRFPASPGIR